MSTLEKRLEAKYIPEPNSGCWIWIGAINNSGYGKISVKRSRPQLAHRVSWELYNPLCVNPEHLWLGTHKENTHDSKAKGRLRNGDSQGEKNGRAILTKEQVVEILKSRETGRNLAKKYGVHEGTISKVRCGVSWSEANHRAESRL